jgi:predicted AlkP superfamily phosphohydrolase/phosphomutase
MMWRHGDTAHPHHEPALAAESSTSWSGREGSTWKDTVFDLYIKMDDVLGRLRERVGEDATIVVMSDHGFAPYRRKFSLNTWLLEKGYLVLKDGAERELPSGDPSHAAVYLPTAVDWTKTRAYGVGYNGLYLNLAGRERDDPKTPDSEAGIVTAQEAPALLAELARALEATTDPDGPGAKPILRCYLASDVYEGERVPEAPDILVGYNSGYGNSDEASLGRIPHDVFQDNTGGTFNGSHLMAPEVVNGVLLTNRPLRPGEHGLEDLTVEILGQYGIEPLPEMKGHRVLQ